MFPRVLRRNIKSHTKCLYEKEQKKNKLILKVKRVFAPFFREYAYQVGLNDKQTQILHLTGVAYHKLGKSTD